MFEFLKKIFGMGSSDSEKIQEIGSKVQRFADRFRNAGMEEGERIAENYAERIFRCTQLEQAEALEKEFYRELKSKRIEIPSEYISDDDREIYHSTGGIYHSHHHHDRSTDDAAIIVGSDMIENTSDGEFGGAGATDSWDENANDNS
jgi:hypothetical protein